MADENALLLSDCPDRALSEPVSFFDGASPSIVQRSEIRNSRECYLCLQNNLSPMCPEWTSREWRARQDSNLGPSASKPLTARRAPQSAGRAQAFSAIVSSCCSSSVVSLRKSHAADVVAGTGSAGSRASSPVTVRRSARAVSACRRWRGSPSRLVTTASDTVRRPPRRPAGGVLPALPPLGPLALALLPGRERLGDHQLEAVHLPGLLDRRLVPKVVHDVAGDPAEHLGDGGLTDPELGGNLPLACPLERPLPRLRPPREDAGPRFSAPFAPALTGPRTSCHQGVHRCPTPSPRFVACRPVKRSQRSIAACTYTGSISIATLRRWVFSAAMMAVPLPTNGSKT